MDVSWEVSVEYSIRVGSTMATFKFMYVYSNVLLYIYYSVGIVYNKQLNAN